MTTFVVLHGAAASSISSTWASPGANGTIIANTVLRFTVVTVFLFVWRATRLSPHVGHQPVVHPVHVVGVSRQLLLQQCFFVVDPNSEYRKADDDDQQAPV